MCHNGTRTHLLVMVWLRGPDGSGNAGGEVMCCRELRVTSDLNGQVERMDASVTVMMGGPSMV